MAVRTERVQPTPPPHRPSHHHTFLSDSAILETESKSLPSIVLTVSMRPITDAKISRCCHEQPWIPPLYLQSHATRACKFSTSAARLCRSRALLLCQAASAFHALGSSPSCFTLRFFREVGWPVYDYAPIQV